MWFGSEYYSKPLNYKVTELLKENGFVFGVVNGDCLVYEE